MRIVYFHGWKGNFNEAKYKILSKFGDDVHYPEINYQNSKNLINAFSNEIYGNGVPTLVVGNSLGGYFAYHISNIVRCPALMFNPAFYFKNGGDIRPNLGYSNNPDPQKQFIISLKDEELDVKRTLKFFKECNFEESMVKIYEDLGHQIPLDVFENDFSEFREKYKNIKGNEEASKKSTSRFSPKYKITANFGPYQPRWAQGADQGDQA